MTSPDTTDTPGTADAPASPDNATARTVTDVFQPRNVLLIGMLGIGLAAASTTGPACSGDSSAPCARASSPPGTSNGSAGAAPGATAMSSTAPSGRRSSS